MLETCGRQVNLYFTFEEHLGEVEFWCRFDDWLLVPEPETNFEDKL